MFFILVAPTGLTSTLFGSGSVSQGHMCGTFDSKTESELKCEWCVWHIHMYNVQKCTYVLVKVQYVGYPGKIGHCILVPSILENATHVALCSSLGLIGVRMCVLADTHSD